MHALPIIRAREGQMGVNVQVRIRQQGAVQDIIRDIPCQLVHNSNSRCERIAVAKARMQLQRPVYALLALLISQFRLSEHWRYNILDGWMDGRKHRHV